MANLEQYPMNRTMWGVSRDYRITMPQLAKDYRKGFLVGNLRMGFLTFTDKQIADYLDKKSAKNLLRGI